MSIKTKRNILVDCFDIFHFMAIFIVKCIKIKMRNLQQSLAFPIPSIMFNISFLSSQTTGHLFLPKSWP